ncbi:unnamed protein product [Moneuplotes crassus]|uniref:Uncharacterized protein n=1 Tax=Euplotes crassus TaxID=5936 RepID=A0AAD1XW26_EUPCR|nr:unnamed protein product [Moneuplotes crassus]
MERYFQVELNQNQTPIIEESITETNPVFFGNELALLDLPPPDLDPVPAAMETLNMRPRKKRDKQDGKDNFKQRNRTAASKLGLRINKKKPQRVPSGKKTRTSKLSNPSSTFTDNIHPLSIPPDP